MHQRVVAIRQRFAAGEQGGRSEELVLVVVQVAIDTAGEDQIGDDEHRCDDADAARPGGT